ncbi:MAG: DEAD/DEAH box helicase family protein [Ardenticatenaceae bacterium]|nr:DEAD/DEAH box helicase family protein [Ardenticatenaceae bacterium]
MLENDLRNALQNLLSLDIEIKGNTIQQIRHSSQKANENSNVDFSKLHATITSSWHNAFQFKDGRPEYRINGLRPPQIGAIHAIQAHCITSREPATIVLPTGTGKTETMLSVMVARRCPRILVIVPSEPLRTQISGKFLTMGILKEIGVVSPEALFPIVCTLKHIPQSTDIVDALFTPSQVIVTTVQLLSQCTDEVKRAIAAYCPYLFVDEAHHREAKSWTHLINFFQNSRVFQFTATPYRNDGKPVTGKIIFNYSLRQAQRDGYFTYINFVPIQEFHPSKEVVDNEIASKAVAKLREDLANGFDHMLMARVNTISRAEQVFKIYSEYSDLKPVRIHTKLSALERRSIRQQIIDKEAKIVVCVDMLGEGFDLPELKIAAFHDIRQSLPVTLQLAGRFTRARSDLGEATIFANVADPPTERELQELYDQNPNWNHLLRVKSEKMVQSQIDLREFIDGFTEITDDIPLQNVRIKMSTAVYRTDCENWQPENFEAGITNKDSYDWIKHDVNSAQNTLVILTVRKVPIIWLKGEEFQSLEMDLYVVFWDSTQKLLFINQTAKGYAEKLASAVTGGATLIKGLPVFRSLADVNRLRLRNVGTREERGRLIRYVMRAGPDVEPAITSTQRQSISRSNIFGAGYENGEEVTVGCSVKGRIWSMRDCNLNEFVQWCQRIGTKVINETIDPTKILEGAIVPQYVTSRPPLIPIAIDWNESLYGKSENSYQVSYGTFNTSLQHVELRLFDILKLEKDLAFSLIYDETEVKYHLIVNDASTRGYYVEIIEGSDVRFSIQGGASITGKAFFEEFPPKIFFADGSSLSGNEFIDLSYDVQPYDARKIIGWDWSGTDITVESQGVKKRTNSIQYRVIQELLKEDYEVIFDDDDPGEAADIVAVRDRETHIEVNLFHCKYSSEPFAGQRVGDLYEVCGQAQKSIRWKTKSSALFDHLLRRSPRIRGGIEYSRFQRGDETVLLSLRNKSRQYPVEFKIHIVQPGLVSNPSPNQLELLSVTENHLMVTYQLPFQVIGSKLEKS